MKRGIKSGIRAGVRIALATILIFVLVPVTEPVRRVEAGKEAVAASGGAVSEATVDWNVMNERLDAAIANGVGENVNFLVGDTFQIPVNFLRKLAGKNATLGLHVGNGVTFSISGQNVQRTDTPIAVSVSCEAVVPEEILAQIPSGEIARQFCMQDKASYPCCVNVHVALGQENAGRYAVLYSYDEAAACLRQEGMFRITEEGQAMFGLARGDEYVVAVTNACTIVPGDTLSHIAVRYHVSLQALKAANPQIKDADRIRVGQLVNIPNQ